MMDGRMLSRPKYNIVQYMWMWSWHNDSFYATCTVQLFYASMKQKLFYKYPTCYSLKSDWPLLHFTATFPAHLRPSHTHNHTYTLNCFKCSKSVMETTGGCCCSIFTGPMPFRHPTKSVTAIFTLAQICQQLLELMLLQTLTHHQSSQSQTVHTQYQHLHLSAPPSDSRSSHQQLCTQSVYFTYKSNTSIHVHYIMSYNYTNRYYKPPQPNYNMQDEHLEFQNAKIQHKYSTYATDINKHTTGNYHDEQKLQEFIRQQIQELSCELDILLSISHQTHYRYRDRAFIQCFSF